MNILAFGQKLFKSGKGKRGDDFVPTEYHRLVPSIFGQNKRPTNR